MSELKKSQFERCDGFVDSGRMFDEKFQEHWIHKQIVTRTGDGEDDWIIEEKPVMIDKVNIFKQIQEEAKTTDLKELLRQFALTGDESIFNRKQGFYGDVTSIQRAIEDGAQIVTPEQVKASLPKELQNLSVEEIARMSDEDIVAYFEQVRKAQVVPEEKVKEKVEEKVNE